MKLTPLNVHAYCASGGMGWTVGFGYRGDGLSLWLACAFDDEPADVVAEISEERRVDAIVERIADRSLDAETVAREQFDLLLTLADVRPDDECSAFLMARITEWIARTRAARMEPGRAA